MVKQKFNDLGYGAIASILSSRPSIYLCMLASELRSSLQCKKEGKEFLTFQQCHQKVADYIIAINEGAGEGIMHYFGDFDEGVIHYHNPKSRVHIEISEDSVHIFSELTDSELQSMQYNVDHHNKKP